MAEATWALKIDGKDTVIEKFKTFEEGIDAALKLVFERFTNIDALVDNASKHKHTKICRAFIEKFRNFSELRSADILAFFEEYNETDYCDIDYTIDEDGFEASTNMALYTIEFGNELFIETNIWDKKAEEYFLFVRTPTDRIRCDIFEDALLPTVPNSFRVYQALTNTPQPRSEIRRKILDKYDVIISEDTISDQIQVLKDIGIPIYYKGLSKKDREQRDWLVAQYGQAYVCVEKGAFREGFYLDYDRPLEADYSNLKPGSYIMLVYLTFKEIDQAHALSTQQQIIDAVYNKFGIKLQRQKVKNYLDLLIKLGSGIKHDKSGYWMKK